MCNSEKLSSLSLSEVFFKNDRENAICWKVPICLTADSLLAHFIRRIRPMFMGNDDDPMEPGPAQTAMPSKQMRAIRTIGLEKIDGKYSIL